MSTRTEMPCFSCDACGSPAITIDGPLHDLAPVKCGGCCKDLGPFDLFVDDLRAALERRSAPEHAMPGHAAAH